MKQNVTPGMIIGAVVFVIAILAFGFYFTQGRLPPPPPIPNMPSGPQSGLVPPGAAGSPSGQGQSQPVTIPGMGGGGSMPGAPSTPGGGMPGAPPTPGGP